MSAHCGLTGKAQADGIAIFKLQVRANSFLRGIELPTNTPSSRRKLLAVCINSQAALSSLRNGRAEQQTQLNRAVYDALMRLARTGSH